MGLQELQRPLSGGSPHHIYDCLALQWSRSSARENDVRDALRNANSADGLKSFTWVLARRAALRVAQILVRTQRDLAKAEPGPRVAK